MVTARDIFIYFSFSFYHCKLFLPNKDEEITKTLKFIASRTKLAAVVPESS